MRHLPGAGRLTAATADRPEGVWRRAAANRVPPQRQGDRPHVSRRRGDSRVQGGTWGEDGGKGVDGRGQDGARIDPRSAGTETGARRTGGDAGCLAAGDGGDRPRPVSARHGRCRHPQTGPEGVWRRALPSTAGRMAESQCSTPDEQPRLDDARLERSRPEAVGSSTSPCGRCLAHPMPRHGKNAALKPQAERRRADAFKPIGPTAPEGWTRRRACRVFPTPPTAWRPILSVDALPPPTSSRLLRWAWALSPSSPCRAQGHRRRAAAPRGAGQDAGP